MSCSSSESRANCVFLALFFLILDWEEMEAMDAATDVTDDDTDPLELALDVQGDGDCDGTWSVSLFCSNGNFVGWADGNDGTSLFPRPWPRPANSW